MIAATSDARIVPAAIRWSSSGGFTSGRRCTGPNGIAIGDKTVSDVEARRPGKIVIGARDIEDGLDVGHVIGAWNQAHLQAQEYARGRVDNLGHRQRLARADIVFAMHELRRFKCRNDRVSDVIDIDIVIDKAGIAGDVGRNAALAISDQRIEMTVAAAIGAVDAAETQTHPPTAHIRPQSPGSAARRRPWW